MATEKICSTLYSNEEKGVKQKLIEKIVKQQETMSGQQEEINRLKDYNKILKRNGR